MRLAQITSLGLMLLVAACSDTGGTPDGVSTNPKGGAAGGGGKAQGGGSAQAGQTAQGGQAGEPGAGGTAGQGGKAQGGGPAGGQAGGGQSGAAQGGKAGVSGNSGQGAAGTGGTAGQPATTSEYCLEPSDCVNNPLAKTCDLTTGKCVVCAPSADTCPAGQYCAPTTSQCVAGCKKDSDCGADKPFCELAVHTCRQCVSDAQCEAGALCVKGSCAVGCSDSKPCADPAQTCCGGSCHALATEIDHCGACDKACPPANNTSVTCEQGSCQQGACADGFADCNKDASDGCEVNVAMQGACVCEPGSTVPCYDGPAGTENVGSCKAGVKVCAPSGMGYIPGCQGQVLPQPEQCGDGQDHDCNGAANDVPDVDGDGWTACQGDCCETTSQCGTPALVNPGAYDVAGDAIDDDCNGIVGPVTCDQPAKLTDLSPDDLARAMEICQTASENPATPQEKRWGLISAQFLLANGSPPDGSVLDSMRNNQTAALDNYGVNPTRKGPTMVGMSSGKMRDKGDPDYSGFGSTYGFYSQPPPLYLAAHGGSLVSSQGCSGNCAAGTGANDPVLLRLRVRVPTNAKSFSYDFRFFSAEYQTYQCTQYNDFFLAMLESQAPGIPADRNLSFDSKNNPVSVNNGFFEVCAKKGCNACPSGTGDLSGTGMEALGGATKWLTTVAPVVPGEVMTLDLTIFDVSDDYLDSLALIDNFQWLATPSSGPTTEPAK